MKVQMSDGRVLIGIFLCTDRNRNLILGNACEYISTQSEFLMTMWNGRTNENSDTADEDGRVLGLAMVPGQHVVSVSVESIT